MKKFCTTALAAMLALLSFPMLSACGSEDEWRNYSDEQLGESEVRYDVSDGAGYLRWAEKSSAESYNVYRSESRFGDFQLINTDAPLTEPRFKTETLCYWYYKVTANTPYGETDVGEPVSAFSENTLVISPHDDMEAVQEYIDAVHSTLETGATGQFSDNRFAMLLLPGEYPDLDVKLGYYTTASGVGRVPADVTVGSLYVSANVLSNQNATCTFWRGAENFTVDGDTRWAVSQATSLRRMQINGDLRLSGSGWSSGGFLANSAVSGTVDPGSQQQWFSRNDEWGGWKHISSHNYVFSGCGGNLPQSVWTESGGRSTVLDVTEKIAEKPFLVYNGSDYEVFVPEAQYATKGVTWADGLEEEAGNFVSLDKFYIANERDTSDTLNAALDKGLNLLFTAGHYKLEKPLEIKRENTVVLGIGYATLEIDGGNTDCAIKVSDVGGVRLADLLVEAGAYSDNMVVVGERGKNTSHKDNPIVLSNIYLRIGGVANVHTETNIAMVIYANDTIGDNFWIWRADHTRGVAWQDAEAYDHYDEKGELVHVEAQYGNPVNTGILVEGDGVACYALMVEHCEGYQTDWQGENGLTVMYQSETPYRVPSQDLWMSDNGKRGCASYRVGEDVQSHRAYGIGIYLVNYSGMVLDSAIEVPENSGILMQHLVICDFTKNDPSSITNVINNYGGGVSNGSRRLVESYPLK